MKIGYPCIHTEIGCKASSGFRLASYSKDRLIETVQRNLDCLEKILLFNLKHKIFFFRISSDLVPFASHPICTYDWQAHFSKQLKNIGNFIKKHDMRISMHPDQFVLINAKDKRIVKNSIRELAYHCQVLDLMMLDETAKIQIHVGGLYGDKVASVDRFIRVYKALPLDMKKRLAIENDDYKYSVQDCIDIHKKINVPVIFDSLHHDCLNNGESYREALKICSKTWTKKDGIPIIDYSTQDKTKRKGAHTLSIDIRHFKAFIKEIKGIDCDIMLEIKDKQKSASRALEVLRVKDKIRRLLVER
ncbi:UV DNA damage repair endonuclease UvsE [Candidatus Dependentiae bacterium]|nr:UV DNA damage repair endonuclease UvsE [Candidatus Dependentiae bacterium]